MVSSIALIVCSPFLGKIFTSSAAAIIQYGVMLAFILVTAFVFYRCKIKKSYIVLLATIICVFISGLLGAFVTNPLIVVIATIVTLKLHYLLFIAMHVPSNFFHRIITLIFWYSLIGGLFFAVSPETFFQLGAPNNWGRNVGFMFDANEFGYLCVPTLFYYIYLKLNLPRAICTLILIIESGSNTALFMVVATVLYISLVKTGKFSTKVLLLSFMGVVLYYIVAIHGDRLVHTAMILTNSLNTGAYYPRVLMFLGGFRLAIEYFPFGAGGGYFATNLTKIYEVYQNAGVAIMLDVENGQGLFDSGIGQLLGQFGFCGSAVVFGSLYYLIQHGSYNLTKKDCFFFLAIILLLNFSLTVISDFTQSVSVLLLLYCLKEYNFQRHTPYDEIR